jgi:hypothetical protein
MWSFGVQEVIFLLVLVVGVLIYFALRRNR